MVEGIKWQGIFLQGDASGYFRVVRDEFPVAPVKRWYENTGGTHCMSGRVSRARMWCGVEWVADNRVRAAV